MRVYKFGGASVKDADSMRNVYEILKLESEAITVVISAMGKTTNALEKVVNAYFSEGDYKSLLNQVLDEHKNHCKDLFNAESHPVFSKLESFSSAALTFLEHKRSDDYAYVYDQIVSLGELMSTTILSEFLSKNAIDNKWIDIRSAIKTDDTHRAGKILWDESIAMINDSFHSNSLSITQGFLGSAPDGSTTTLGREGSDFTAAILAHAMNADSVTTWKDVPGILNADPREIKDAELIPALSYSEAVEMTYYGAKVIHPKTIQPLFSKRIPLYVRSFKDPSQEGTTISEASSELPPVIVMDKDQLWLKIKANDLSFIAEKDIVHILNIFSDYDVKINLLQTAALTLSAAITHQPRKIDALLKRLKESYQVDMEENLSLFTIRHYSEEAIEKYLADKSILIEQRSEKTIQCLIRNEA